MGSQAATTWMPSASAPANFGRTSMSRRWFGLDWEELLPWDLGGVVVEHGELDEALRFATRYYPTIFRGRPDQRFLQDPMTRCKRRFYQEADVFLLREGSEPVGLQIGHPSDWSSYYIRTVALLPRVRGRGLIAELTGRMVEPLRRAGFQRMEGDIPPANAANLTAQTRLGYVATGMVNTERWGSMVRLTKYLTEDADEAFRKQFCSGSWPRSCDLSTTGPERSAP